MTKIVRKKIMDMEDRQWQYNTQVIFFQVSAGQKQ